VAENDRLRPRFDSAPKSPPNGLSIGQDQKTFLAGHADRQNVAGGPVEPCFHQGSETARAEPSVPQNGRNRRATFNRGTVMNGSSSPRLQRLGRQARYTRAREHRRQIPRRWPAQLKLRRWHRRGNEANLTEARLCLPHAFAESKRLRNTGYAITCDRFQLLRNHTENSHSTALE